MARKRTADVDEMRLVSSVESTDSDGATVREDVFVPKLDGAGTSEGDIPPLPEPESASGDAPAPRQKRKYTRRKAKAASPEPVAPAGPTPEEIDALGGAVGEAFAIVARIAASRRGEHWMLAPDEKERIGRLWAIALAPHMGGAGKWAPFAIATLATVGVVVPRIEEDGRRVRELRSAALPSGRDDNGDDTTATRDMGRMFGSAHG